MASSLKNLSSYDPTHIPSAESKKFGIVVTDYHTDITYKLLEGCHNTLLEQGTKPENITVWHVPGTFELPLAAKLLFKETGADAIICLGCVITGETKHDEYINQSVSRAIMNLGLLFSIPFVFGVLTPRTKAQALDRAGGKHGNKGIEAAITAIKMSNLRTQNKPIKKGVGFKLGL